MSNLAKQTWDPGLLTAHHAPWRNTVESSAQRLRIWGSFLGQKGEKLGAGRQTEKTTGCGTKPGMSHKLRKGRVCLRRHCRRACIGSSQCRGEPWEPLAQMLPRRRKETGRDKRALSAQSGSPDLASEKEGALEECRTAGHHPPAFVTEFLSLPSSQRWMRRTGSSGCCGTGPRVSFHP